jgi:hypothetical protein
LEAFRQRHELAGPKAAEAQALSSVDSTTAPENKSRLSPAEPTHADQHFAQET